MRSIIEILAISLLLAVAILIPLALLFGPSLLELYHIDLGRFILPAEQEEQPDPFAGLGTDAQRYYTLKNLSCQTLSGDFLIVTNDISTGSMKGLIETAPGELEIAQSLLAAYDTNQTTKTYVRGDWLKRVVIAQNTEHTTIWKDSRIYNCTSGCTMHLMNENESVQYRELLYDMKQDCAHFAKTAMPSFVNMSMLLDIEHTGRSDSKSFRCDNFLIIGNKSYAKELLASNQSSDLNEDQKALLWGIMRLEGPVVECLDESTGIIAFRNLTIDLTEDYRFEYEENGYMKVSQQTVLEYFTTTVPESFFAIPS